jgi:c-di-GMP-binding flagellar brake protein YcgR
MSKPSKENQLVRHERRGYPRIRIGARVSIRQGSLGVLMATTVNISDGGMQVQLEKHIKIPVGSHLQVNMLNSANPNISFNMKVIRSYEDILGMQFIDYEFEGQRHKIDELIAGMKGKK